MKDTKMTFTDKISLKIQVFNQSYVLFSTLSSHGIHSSIHFYFLVPRENPCMYKKNPNSIQTDPRPRFDRRTFLLKGHRATNCSTVQPTCKTLKSNCRLFLERVDIPFAACTPLPPARCGWGDAARWWRPPAGKASLRGGSRSIAGRASGYRTAYTTFHLTPSGKRSKNPEWNFYR